MEKKMVGHPEKEKGRAGREPPLHAPGLPPAAPPQAKHRQDPPYTAKRWALAKPLLTDGLARCSDRFSRGPEREERGGGERRRVRTKK